jgi:addiction module HigA family antidote
MSTTDPTSIAALPALDPIHPGEILREEFLVPLGLSAAAVARALGVPTNRLTEILRGRRAITADTSLRLGRYFGVSPGWFLALQSSHDLAVGARAGVADQVVPLEPAGPPDLAAR